MEYSSTAGLCVLCQNLFSYVQILELMEASFKHFCLFFEHRSSEAMMVSTSVTSGFHRLKVPSVTFSTLGYDLRSSMSWPFLSKCFCNICCENVADVTHKGEFGNGRRPGGSTGTFRWWRSGRRLVEDDASSAVKSSSKNVNTDKAKMNRFQNEWNGTCVHRRGGRVRCESVPTGGLL